MTTPFDAQSLLLIEAIGAATADWRISVPDDYPLPKWAANLAVFGGALLLWSDGDENLPLVAYTCELLTAELCVMAEAAADAISEEGPTLSPPS